MAFSFSTPSETISDSGKTFASGPGSSTDTAVAASKWEIPFMKKIDRLTGSNEDGERIELKRQYVTLSEEDEIVDDGLMGEIHGRYGAGLADLKHERAGMGRDLEVGKGDTGSRGLTR